MQALINTIGQIFDPVLDFFVQVWDNVVNFLTVAWDCISGIFYGFNTIINHLWTNFQSIIGLDLFGDNIDNVSYLVSFLGVTANSLFLGLVFISMFYVVFKFVVGLLPFFRK